MFQSGGDVLDERHARSQMPLPGFETVEGEHGLVAGEHCCVRAGQSPRSDLGPRDDRAGGGHGLEADGGHAADLSVVGGHDLHFDGRFAARLERAQRPDELAVAALRRLRGGAQEPRAAWNLIVDLDLRGCRSTGVMHDGPQDGRPANLDFRRAPFFAQGHLRVLRPFERFLSPGCPVPFWRRNLARGRLLKDGPSKSVRIMRDVIPTSRPACIGVGSGENDCAAPRPPRRVRAGTGVALIVAR